MTHFRGIYIVLYGVWITYCTFYVAAGKPFARWLLKLLKWCRRFQRHEIKKVAWNGITSTLYTLQSDRTCANALNCVLPLTKSNWIWISSWRRHDIKCSCRPVLVSRGLPPCTAVIRADVSSLQGYQKNKPNWSIWSTERPPTRCVHKGYWMITVQSSDTPPTIQPHIELAGFDSWKSGPDVADGTTYAAWLNETAMQCDHRCDLKGLFHFSPTFTLFLFWSTCYTKLGLWIHLYCFVDLAVGCHRSAEHKRWLILSSV